MTWEELEALPDEIAQYIELHDGHPVWIADEVFAKHSQNEHQVYTRRFTNALESITRRITAESVGPCWRSGMESNLFFAHDRSSFVTPDFMVFRCLEDEFDWIYAEDAVLVGEVLSPANTRTKIEEKKARYAAGGIPWYWEVDLGHHPRRVDVVREYALAVGGLLLPEGVTPLHRSNYIQTNEWTFDNNETVETVHPFPITISWTDLAY